MFIGVSRTKHLKPKPTAKYLTSIAIVVHQCNAYPKAIMQTLVKLAGFNDHRNSLADISIEWKTLMDKLKYKFTLQCLMKPKTIIWLDSQTSSRVDSIIESLTDVLKGENISPPELSDIFLRRLPEKNLLFSRDSVHLIFWVENYWHFSCTVRLRVERKKTGTNVIGLINGPIKENFGRVPLHGGEELE